MTTETTDSGAMTSEMAVIMATFFAGFLVLVILAGRIGQAENDVRSAAHEAARAATLERSADQARAAAVEVATDNLSSSGVRCQDSAVSVDTSNFAPAGWVTVTVECRVSFGDVVSLGVPGSQSFSAQATEVIDVFRSSP